MRWFYGSPHVFPRIGVVPELCASISKPLGYDAPTILLNECKYLAIVLT